MYATAVVCLALIGSPPFSSDSRRCAARTNLTTEARLTPYFFEHTVRDNPASRHARCFVINVQRDSTKTLPFELARRMPALMRSTIRFRSSSAIAPRSRPLHDRVGRQCRCFPKADELDAEMVQFVKDFKEMSDRASHAIECPYRHHIKASSAASDISWSSRVASPLPR